MSSFTDSLYRSWLRQNGSGTSSRVAAGARGRGYGAQPHGRVHPRDVPNAGGAEALARRDANDSGSVCCPALSEPSNSPESISRGAGDNATADFVARPDKQIAETELRNLNAVDSLFKSDEDYYLGAKR